MDLVQVDPEKRKRKGDIFHWSSAQKLHLEDVKTQPRLETHGVQYGGIAQTSLLFANNVLLDDFAAECESEIMVLSQREMFSSGNIFFRYIHNWWKHKSLRSTRGVIVTVLVYHGEAGAQYIYSRVNYPFAVCVYVCVLCVFVFTNRE